ncbi:TPA: prefoldin subunit beta [Candidatus Micrarchaeota archaeon]|nr:prefoldin subunit beta [Candidatus Micrarchaeota archaeon]
MELSENQRKDLMELQALQQQLQVVLMQKQQLLLQQGENEKAQAEVGKIQGTIYRFAGSILVPKESKTLVGELAEEKESIDVRLTALAKQEKKMRERFEELRASLEKSFPRSGNSTTSLS